EDVYYFREGTHSRLYRVLGAHLGRQDGEAGVHFAVWAPNAAFVAVIGDFNGWDRESHPLAPRDDESGIFEGFVAGASRGECYKYHVRSRHRGFTVDKGDPFAFRWEVPPGTASRIWSLEHEWQDDDWMARRAAANALDAPWSIYEVHLGSWSRSDREGRPLSYRAIAEPLADYV